MKQKKTKILKAKREVAIQLKNVTKRYVVHHEKPTFSEKLVNRKKKVTFTALDNINLTIYRGEKVGIIGSNGAGKTTLLKIISGITTPNEGTVVTNGKIVSLIDLEAGFHPDLSGEENIYLNGFVIGMSKHRIQQKFNEIVAFADIGEFIDVPMYTYSQGMKLRLGFAIAINAEPDILILDENVSVGDQDFQKKCSNKIQDLFYKGKTILLVSQWHEYLRANCKRFLTIHSKRVSKDTAVI